MTQSYFESDVLQESSGYHSRGKNRIPCAVSENRPNHYRLYRHALYVIQQNPQAANFMLEGAQWTIIYAGPRLCIMHTRSRRVVCGAPMQ